MISGPNQASEHCGRSWRAATRLWSVGAGVVDEALHLANDRGAVQPDLQVGLADHEGVALLVGGLGIPFVAVGLRLQEDAFRPERQKQRLGVGMGQSSALRRDGPTSARCKGLAGCRTEPKDVTSVPQDRSPGTEPHSSQVH